MRRTKPVLLPTPALPLTLCDSWRVPDDEQSLGQHLVNLVEDLVARNVLDRPSLFRLPDREEHPDRDHPTEHRPRLHAHRGT
jgi:hypothetical protein